MRAKVNGYFWGIWDVGSNQPLRVVIWAAVSTEAQAADERASLPAQVADGRAWANANGHVVIDELIVPGFSRRYYNLPEFAAALKKETDNDAGERLMRYIRERAFDVFVCRDADRFGREQSLVSEVIARIIDSGARIYTLNEGWIDAQHYRMVSALSGMRAASYVDDLRRKNQLGMDKRARSGLPTAIALPASHVRVRDERGKTVGLALNPEARPMLDLIAERYIAGHSYQDIARALNERGYTGTRGRAWHPASVRQILHNPTFWGIAARQHTKYLNDPDTFLWIVDPAIQPPDNVIFVRGAFPAAYTGEQAARVVAEMKRRMTMTGSESSKTIYRYSRLVACAECGQLLTPHYSHGKRIGLRCFAAVTYSPTLKPCDNKRTTLDSALQTAISLILDPLIRDEPDDTFMTPPAADDSSERLRTLAERVANLEAQIDTLIDEQRLASPSLMDNYRRKIDALAQQRDLAQSDYDALARTAGEAVRRAEINRQSVDALRAMTLEAFWRLPDREVNALLVALFGVGRLIARGNDVGIIPA